MPVRIILFVLWPLAVFVSACAPDAFGFEKEASPFDATLGTITGRDAGSGLDSANTRDAAFADGQLQFDAIGRDGTLGPRIDSSLRDTSGLDLTLGPRRDAAGQDQNVPDPGSQSCNQWQDCAPHYSDSNSGYECIASLCVCDPNNQMMTQCTTSGGVWLGAECFCETNATDPMPNSDAGYPDCWWTWVQDSCEPDYWVDTSYEQCYCCDDYGYDICDWIYDGYWESGYCPPGYWDERCY